MSDDVTFEIGGLACEVSMPPGRRDFTNYPFPQRTLARWYQYVFVLMVGGPNNCVSVRAILK
jgi:hypothetical protein